MCRARPVLRCVSSFHLLVLRGQECRCWVPWPGRVSVFYEEAGSSVLSVCTPGSAWAMGLSAPARGAALLLAPATQSVTGPFHCGCSVSSLMVLDTSLCANLPSVYWPQ